MSYQVILPPLEDGAIEFVVEQYYVDVDVSVVVGQAVALVRSARFAWDIPATMSGIVSRLAAEEDSMVTPGAPLLEIREQGTGDREQGTGNREQEARTTGNREQEEAAAQRVRATPVARRMAARHDINLATLSGTGRGKSITRADVLAVIGNRDEGAGMRAQEAESREQGTRISPQHAALSTQHSVSTFQPSNLPTFQLALRPDRDRGGCQRGAGVYRGARTAGKARCNDPHDGVCGGGNGGGTERASHAQQCMERRRHHPAQPRALVNGAAAPRRYPQWNASGAGVRRRRS